MITRAVAYTLSVRTSPHIGPRCGFHLLCEYFESLFWLHLHCVFYLGESVLYLDYCNPRYSQSRKPLRLSVSNTLLYFCSYTKRHRRRCRANYMNLMWCGGRVQISPLTRLDSETVKAMGNRCMARKPTRKPALPRHARAMQRFPCGQEYSSS
jgi:hypothetical protein